MDSQDTNGWGLPPWRLLREVDSKVSRLLADGKRRTIEQIMTELEMRDKLEAIQYVLNFLPNKYAEVLRENRRVKYTLKRFREDDDSDLVYTPVPIIIIGKHAADRLFRARFSMSSRLSADELIHELNEKFNQAYFYEHPAHADTYILQYPEFGSELVIKPRNENTYFAMTYMYRRGRVPANVHQMTVQYILADGRGRGAATAA